MNEMKTNSENIRLFGKFLKIKNVPRYIYLLAVSTQLIGILIFKTLYTHEYIVAEPRYETAAYNFLKNGSFSINWDTPNNADLRMGKAYDIQKGIYYNWFPIGYATFLSIPLLFGKYYIITRTIMQLLIFAFIPVMIFLIMRILFEKKNNRNILSLVGAIIFCFYPYFIVSSLMEADTWPIVIINIIAFYLFLNFKFDIGRNMSFLGLAVCLLFFLKPIAIIPYGVLILHTIYINIRLPKKQSIRLYLLVILPIVLSILGWGVRNYKLSGAFCLSNSNGGYNIWLGNNEFTNIFLKQRLGDATPIEEDIIPLVDKKWYFLKYYNEYEKDTFLKNAAIDYVKTNPGTTLHDMSWKTVGFWSPLRMHSGHWSESKNKTFMTVLFAGPLLFLSLLSIIRFFIKKEYNWNRKRKLWWLLFPFGWFHIYYSLVLSDIELHWISCYFNWQWILLNHIYKKTNS